MLNAKQHEREAHIVAQAGRPGTVTIATNMAGRGTDIVLGGNLEAELHGLENPDGGHRRDRCGATGRSVTTRVVEAGGLHIVGTERHESRRIDNQLRGRSGRQGDPGSSRFYLSLEDNLMRIFGDPNRTKALLSRVGMKEGEVIESRMLTRQIEKAQRKVEAHNFDARKNLLEYDDVANDQRKVIYQQRTELMAAEDVGDAVRGIREEVVNNLISQFVPPGSVTEQWDVAGLGTAIERDFGLRLDIKSWLDRDQALDEQGLRKRIAEEIANAYEQKVTQYGVPFMRHVEKAIMLQQLDAHWREHLAAMDYMRQGIHLRRLRAEEPEAGVQARGLRAVQRDARSHQVRHGDGAFEAAGAQPGGHRARRAGAATTSRARAAGTACAGAIAGRSGGARPGRRAGRAPARRRPASSVRARRSQSGSQRAVSMRFREEVQALPRRAAGRCEARSVRTGRPGSTCRFDGP